MKKLIATMTLATSLLISSSPAFAYEVKRGDTMYKIAREHNMSLSDLAKANPQIKNINLIYVGQNVNTVMGTTPTPQPTVNTEVKKEEQVIVHSVHSLTASERDLLARLVRAEANSESFEGKVAVARVVLNRIESSQFPDTVESVIYQKGQFSPVSNGAINKAATEDARRAVEIALSTPNDGSLYFYAPKWVTGKTAEWFESLTTVKVIGNHVFKK